MKHTGQPTLLNDPNSAYGTPSNLYSVSQNPSMPPTAPPDAPPFYPYTKNQGGPGYSPPPSAPLPLGEAIKGLPQQYTKGTTRPGVMTFAAEMGKASWDIVWVQLIGQAIILALLSYLRILILHGFNAANFGTVGLPLVSIIMAPMFFFIGMGILYGLARAFGGQGKFVTQCYTYLLFSVPIGIVSGVVFTLIPVAGSFIAIALGIYGIVLTILSLKAVHRLSGGKATAVVLIPAGVVLLVAFALAILFGTLIVAALQL
jgi:Yip1 domain